jgi:hypothetical protein
MLSGRPAPTSARSAVPDKHPVRPSAPTAATGSAAPRVQSGERAATGCLTSARDAAAAYPCLRHQRTNGLAIAGLVLGILWFYWIGSVLALIFGYVSKGQIDSSDGTQ